MEDWHTTFLRDYADCNYTDLEYIEEGDSVAVRATIEAKGYNWRPFTQRVVEVFDFVGGGVSERRMYGMLRDVELDKPSTAAMTGALEFRGRCQCDAVHPRWLLRGGPGRRFRDRDHVPRRQGQRRPDFVGNRDAANAEVMGMVPRPGVGRMQIHAANLRGREGRRGGDIRRRQPSA